MSGLLEFYGLSAVKVFGGIRFLEAVGLLWVSGASGCLRGALGLSWFQGFRV